MSRRKTMMERTIALSSEQSSSSRTGSSTRLIQRAPATGASVAPQRPAAALLPTSELRTNLRQEPAVAVIVVRGSSIDQGELESVGPGASATAPAGSRVAGLIYADGTAVQFHGLQGGVYLTVAIARREFGSHIDSARLRLASSTASAKPAIHRRADSAGSVARSPAVDAALQSSASRPLPKPSQAALESSFGTTLSGVKVHTDSHADQAAKALQAKAFATGQDIYFRSGQFQPGSPSGDHLLAHEVAHTVQQGSTPSSIARSLAESDWRVSQPGDRHEQDADRAADAAVQQRPYDVTRFSGSPSPLSRRIETAGGGPASTAPATQAPATAAPATASASQSAPAKAAVTDKAEPVSTGPLPGAVQQVAPAAGAMRAAGSAPKESEEASAVGAAGASGAVGASPEVASSGAGLAFVAAEVAAAGQAQRAHPPASIAAAETARSTDVTAEEAKGKAKGDQVQQMAGQKPKRFNSEAFKSALKKKIGSLQATDAKGIKEGDQAQSINGAVKAEVAAEKSSAAGPIQQASAQSPAAGEVKPGVPLRPANPTPAAAVDGARVIPGPVPAEQRSMAAESLAVDQKMASAQVTPEQLQRANEPAFQAAADSHSAAKAEAAALPERASTAEASVLQDSRKQVAQATQSGLSEMQGRSAEKLGTSHTEKVEGKAKYEETRKRISDQLGAIYEETKQTVDTRLTALDQEVNALFDSEASFAKTKFYVNIASKLLIYYGGGGWLVDAFTGGNTKEQIFQECQAQYMQDMDAVIDSVARLVENGLNEVVGMIDAGRVRLESALKQFGTSDAAIAQEVAGGLREQFSALEKSVDDKQAEIVDSLAAKYVAAQKEVQSTIDTLRDPVGALIDFAVDAVSGVIDTILKMKDLLTSALAKAGEAIDLILADPIGFLGNLVAGVKQGVMGFLSNIGTYLQKGLLDWLFGALSQAGIQMPETFDLSGLMSIVLQVLGLTWTNIRQRAVTIVGEPVVQALETGSEIIKTLITKGAAGLWEYIKEQASALMETVKEGVKSFIMESVIVAGVKWLIGLLNPASAFVKACLAIYDIVTFILNKGQQILAFVNAVLDSILAIAKGNIAPAAKAVESALARSIPVAIGFLASLLGVGDLGEKIKKVIDKIQAPVNKVIDWLIKKAVSLVKAIGKLFGVGGKEKEERGTDSEYNDKPIVEQFTMKDGEEHTLTSNDPESDVFILASSNPGNHDTKAKEMADTNDSGNASLLLQLDSLYTNFKQDANAAAAKENDKKKKHIARKRVKEKYIKEHFSELLSKLNLGGGRVGQPKGIWTVAPHSSQIPRETLHPLTIWHMQSEHVIPRAVLSDIVDFLLEMKVAVPMAGAIYNDMDTLMIYRGAAKKKDKRDATTIAKCRGALKRMRIKEKQISPESAFGELREIYLSSAKSGIDATEQSSNEERSGKEEEKGYTLTNAERRGERGTKGSEPYLDVRQIQKAAASQREVIFDLFFKTPTASRSE